MELRCRPSDVSWWTPECTAAVNAKQKAWRQLQRHISSDIKRTVYRSATQYATTRIARARQAHTDSLRRSLEVCVTSSGGLPLNKLEDKIGTLISQSSLMLLGRNLRQTKKKQSVSANTSPTNAASAKTILREHSQQFNLVLPTNCTSSASDNHQ